MPRNWPMAACLSSRRALGFTELHLRSIYLATRRCLPFGYTLLVPRLGFPVVPFERPGLHKALLCPFLGLLRRSALQAIPRGHISESRRTSSHGLLSNPLSCRVSHFCFFVSSGGYNHCPLVPPSLLRAGLRVLALPCYIVWKVGITGQRNLEFIQKHYTRVLQHTESQHDS